MPHEFKPPDETAIWDSQIGRVRGTVGSSMRSWLVTLFFLLDAGGSACFASESLSFPGAASLTPRALERRLSSDAAFATSLLDQIQVAGTLQESDLHFLAAASRERSRRLASEGPPWDNNSINEILTLAFIDPNRFFQSGSDFTTTIWTHLPGTVGVDTPAELRFRVLKTIAALPGANFDRLEAIAVGWGLHQRLSRPRERPFESGSFELVDDGTSPITSHLFSLPSTHFDPAACLETLRSVRSACPEAELLVLSDFMGSSQPAARTFCEELRSMGCRLLPTLGQSPPSPWLRDPMLPLEDEEGRLIFLSRPNRQSGRESDLKVSRQLVSAAAQDWDEEHREVSWSPCPTPFHGGHLIFTPGSVWLSVHSVETRVLELMNIDRIDVTKLLKPEGWANYCRAVDAAVDELGAALGVQTNLVHPWPSPPPGMSHSEFISALGGGNDIDLDVLLTLIPDQTSHAGVVALVGSTDASRPLIEKLTATELETFAQSFGMDLPATQLRPRLQTWQGSPKVSGLEDFLKLVSLHLASMDIPVATTPLVFVETKLITSHPRLSNDQPHVHFPLGHCNAVLERVAPTANRNSRSMRAHAFMSGLPSLDSKATSAYEEIGCQLHLHPPLIESLVLEGGFRCATQQIRKR